MLLHISGDMDNMSIVHQYNGLSPACRKLITNTPTHQPNDSVNVLVLNLMIKGVHVIAGLP